MILNVTSRKTTHATDEMQHKLMLTMEIEESSVTICLIF